MNGQEPHAPRVIVHELADGSRTFAVSVVCGNLETAEMVAQLVAARLGQALASGAGYTVPVMPGRPPAEA